MLGVENIGKSLFFVWSLCTWSVWQNGTDLSENVILRGIFDFLKASVLLNTFFIFDCTMRFLTIAQWNIVQYSDAVQIESDIGFILLCFIHKTPGKHHHTIMYDTRFSYYMILRGFIGRVGLFERHVTRLNQAMRIVLFYSY